MLLPGPARRRLEVSTNCFRRAAKRRDRFVAGLSRPFGVLPTGRCSSPMLLPPHGDASRTADLAEDVAEADEDAVLRRIEGYVTVGLYEHTERCCHPLPDWRDHRKPWCEC